MLTKTQFLHRITTDFAFFCRHIKIVARDYKLPPTEEKIRTIPFILTTHQKELIEYIERQDIPEKIIIKTRQIGVSTTLFTYALWKILYGTNQNILYLINEDKKAVEFRHTIENIYYNMPAAIRPVGLTFAGSKIRNKKRHNLITLSTATEKSGRSETFSLTVADEFAYYDLNVQKAVDGALPSGCPNNRVFVSTPHGEADLFAQKVYQAEADGTLYKRTFWDVADEWFGSRENAQDWFNTTTKNKSQAVINRELLCELKGSVEDLAWCVDDTCFIPVTQPKPSESIIVSLDLGFGDPTAIIYAVERNKILYIWGAEEVKEKSIPIIINKLKALPYRIKYICMDSSGKKVDQTSGISSYDMMRKGLARPIYTHKIPDKIEMLRRANNALLTGRAKVDTNCKALLELFNNYAYHNTKLPHDRYSHLHDALCYLILNWEKVGRLTNANQITFGKGPSIYLTI